jgi:hypothetical protein
MASRAATAPQAKALVLVVGIRTAIPKVETVKMLTSQIV